MTPKGYDGPENPLLRCEVDARCQHCSVGMTAVNSSFWVRLPGLHSLLAEGIIKLFTTTYAFSPYLVFSYVFLLLPK